MAKSKTIKCRTCKQPTKKVISGDKKAGYYVCQVAQCAAVH